MGKAVAARSFRLWMPNGGEDGVIIATRNDGVTVEFRGAPYSKWEIGEDTPMYKLHSLLERVNISELHNSEVEVLTPWHKEWEAVVAMFDKSLNSADS